MGLFDSGVGGLTVLARIAARMPNERFLYIADQAHVPYGGRPLSQIESFAHAMTERLLHDGAKAVVMACNISSAVALPAERARLGAHIVMGMIQPGARAAIASTQTQKIGVLATEGTVSSGAYTATIGALAPRVQVFERPCPSFVPLIESGAHQGPKAVREASDRLAPLIRAGVDTVVLGCTHYPFLLPALERAAQGAVRFVDPAEQTAIELEQSLRKRGLLAASPGSSTLWTTGDPVRFEQQAREFVQLPATKVAALAWPLLPLANPALQ